MNFQYKGKNDLFQIDEKRLSKEIALDFFSSFGYDLIYVTKDDKLMNILSYKNLNTIYSKNDKLWNSVFDISRCRNWEDAEKIFLNSPNLEYIVVLDKGQLVGEYYHMVKPPLQNRVTMDLIALRQISPFKKDVEKLLKNYSKILLIGSVEVCGMVKDIFSNVTFDSIHHIKDYENKNYDLILDFLYGQRLMGQYDSKLPTKSFSKLVENLVFQHILDFCNEHHINLQLYKTPDYHRLTNISDYEKSIISQGLSTNDLLENSEVVKEFSTSKENYDFIRSKGYNNSLRFDNYHYYGQTDCRSHGCNVINGFRQVIGHIPDPRHNVYVVGQCNTFGMFVSDDETLQSLLQKKINDSGQKINILNYGGMHGNSPFNMYALISNSCFHPNDTIIILDIFTDLNPKFHYKINDMTPWFNQDLNKNGTYYFNYIEHNNVKAYQVMANHMYEDIIKYYNDYPSQATNDIVTMKQMFDQDFIYFSITNASLIKLRNKLEVLKNTSPSRKKVCYFITLEDIKHIEKTVDSVLAKNDFIYIFIGTQKNNNYNFIEIYKKLIQLYEENQRVKIISLDNYLVFLQYDYKEDWFIKMLVDGLIDTLWAHLKPKSFIIDNNNKIKYKDFFINKCKSIGADLSIS
jgi:hypothetical protein